MKDSTLPAARAITPFFPVAGIAAGPGGMQALIKLVSAIPEDAEMAFVIIREHSSEYPDNLYDAVAKYAALPVSEIINTVDFLPNHIYIIPQNSDLVVQEGRLGLHHRTRLDKAEESFDIFFSSLACVYKSAAVGIILSGSGFHGIQGFKKLKEIAAATIAQAPHTSLFREMPLNIINAGLADYTETPEGIPALLKKIVQSFTNTKVCGQEEATDDASQELITNILNIIFLRSGIDFSHYKQHLVGRRMGHRMVTTNKNTLQDYHTFLRHNKEEQDQLFNDLLITVTGFFRDAVFYKSLATDVFPHIVHNAESNTLRIWIAGCSSGQEAYSVAISFHEYLVQSNNTGIELQIFASDLSVPSIAKARKGIYAMPDLYAISQIRLQKYFIKRNDGYHLADVIRNMCIFTAHNLVKDPPLANIDLVCCHNVLPYFDEFNRNLALGAFGYALGEKGVLALGRTDNPVKGQHLFENFAGHENLYIRNSAPGQSGGIIATASENPNRQSTIPNVKASLQNLKDAEDHLHFKNENLKQKNNLLNSYTKDLQSQDQELQIMKDELADRQNQLSASVDFTETIIQTIHEPVLLIDKDLNIISANPAFYKYFKTAKNKTAGYGFFEVGNCQWDVADFKGRINSVLRDKTALQNYKVETECEGLGKKIMNVSARMLFAPSPEDMILIALQDITELDSAKEIVEAKKIELQQYNELLQTFAVAASNNIVDPLQKIHMLGKRIADSEMSLSEPGRHNLQRIVFSAANMSKLIEDLIVYSKLSFLKKEYKKTDLNLIVKKNLKDLKSLLQQKKAVVKVGSLPKLEVIPSMIQQLFTNIIFNAIQYSKDDVIPEINIDINQPSIEEITKFGGNPDISFAKITVTDNGIGFDKRYETQIFDPFFRLHNNDQYIGSGLGLTLVKKIVSSHHGYIIASSQINHGTEINIYIPIQQT